MAEEREASDLVALCRAAYNAQQVPGAVIIVANGVHRTDGFAVWFEQRPTRIYPPEHSLHHRASSDGAADVITPFSVHTSFAASERIAVVRVYDAAGRHDVSVDQAPDTLDH